MRPWTSIVAVALMAPLLLGACRQQVSRRGADLTAVGIESLRVDMTPDQVTSLLGSPLLTHYDAPPGSEKRISIYAEHGGWRIFGSEGLLVGDDGIDLNVIFQNEKLAQALLANPSACAICVCSHERCDSGWASQCLIGVQW